MLVLADEQIEQDWCDTHPDERRATNVVYTRAKVRRKYRQAYVMRHWDKTDCQILFLNILGKTYKEMEPEMGITRQAIQKRVARMCRQIGVEEEIQLVLWILGFLTVHEDGKISTTGTSLISSQDFNTPFGRHVLSNIRVPSFPRKE